MMHHACNIACCVVSVECVHAVLNSVCPVITLLVTRQRQRQQRDLLPVASKNNTLH